MPSTGLPQRTAVTTERGVPQRGVEQPAEGLARPLLVLLVVFRRHDRHEQRVGPGGKDLGEDVQQVQLGPQRTASAQA